MKNSKNQFKVNEQALINDILTNGRTGRTWGELAIQYNIRPNVDLVKRRKSANDVWRRFLKYVNKNNLDLVTVKQTLNGAGEVLFETQKRDRIPFN